VQQYVRGGGLQSAIPEIWQQEHVSFANIINCDTISYVLKFDNNMNHPNVSVKKVNWLGVTTYLGLCFGATWAIEISCLAMGMRFDTERAAVIVVLGFVMFMPALAAYIVRKWVTKEGFATANLRRGALIPYLLIWLGVPLLFALVYGVSALLGWGRFESDPTEFLKNLPPLPPGKQLPHPGVIIESVGIASLTVGALVTSIFTFGEEFGWTGYLLPALAPLGKWRAIFMYGTIWGVWHAPIVFGGFNYPSHPIAGMFMMCLFTISIGITQYFLWDRYRSVYLTSFLHGCINSQARGVWPILFTQVHPLLGGLVGLVGLVTISGAGLLLHSLTPKGK
jgi:hypothetical protein